MALMCDPQVFVARPKAGAALAATLLIHVLVFLAAPARAQTITGIVTDAGTGEPLSGVALLLRNERSAVVARAETEADGGFQLIARDTGPHSIEAALLGYADVAPLRLDLDREVLEVEIQMSRSPLQLEPLIVRGRRHDPRHDATFEGAMVRYARFPDVGSRRVVLRTDPELRSAIIVSDVLRWFPPQRGCTIVFHDGVLVTTLATAEMWLRESSAAWFEAVEYYRSWSDAPQGLKDLPSYVWDSPDRCSVVALWPRDDDPPSSLAWSRRGLYLVASVGLSYLAGWLWMRR